MPEPTPYPDVNAVLSVLLLGVQAALGPRLVGLYLYGSLAAGDFDPRRSDIDFLVVTAGELPDGLFRTLADMHAGLAASGVAWMKKLEGVYLPEAALRCHDPAQMAPYLGVDRPLAMEPLGRGWVIERHTLREHGVAVAGPSLRPLIDPVSPDDLRQAVRAILTDWWARQLTDSSFLRPVEYQAFAVLSMCRALHTLATGELASKLAAARWALQTLDARWAALIGRALAWPDGPQPDSLPETLDFIRYTLEKSAA